MLAGPIKGYKNSRRHMETVKMNMMNSMVMAFSNLYRTKNKCPAGWPNETVQSGKWSLNRRVSGVGGQAKDFTQEQPVRGMGVHE